MSVDIAELLPPACPLGYTREQVEQVVAERWDEFVQWSRGMTCAICEGRRYDYDKRGYEPTECADSPHGVVVYPWDVAQFMRGGQPLD